MSDTKETQTRHDGCKRQESLAVKGIDNSAYAKCEDKDEFPEDDAHVSPLVDAGNNQTQNKAGSAQ